MMMEEPQATVPLPKSVIRIVGTSHIAKESERHIKRVYAEFQPDIIAVELDKRRLEGLLDKIAHPEQKEQRLPLSMARTVGVTGYLFLLIGRTMQKRLGSIVDVQPGVDMLAGVMLAKQHGKKLALVDRDIMITLRRLSQAFTFREKMRMLWDVISAPFVPKSKRPKIALDKVPESKLITELMSLLKERYPSLHNVLIVERNIYMAVRLDGLVRANPGKKILLIIGAGHEEDLRERLENLTYLVDVV